MDHHIEGCVECYACQKPGSGFHCAQKDDDGNAILGKMLAADAIVFAAPLFNWSFPGQMKLLLDRMFCVVKAGGTPDHRSALQGKVFALLVTCAGPLERNTEEIQQLFKRMVFWFRGVNAGLLVVPFCGRLGIPGMEAGEMAHQLAQAIMNCKGRGSRYSPPDARQ